MVMYELCGDREIGSVRVPLLHLISGSGSGEADFRIESPDGAVLAGMSGKRAQMCVRWHADQVRSRARVDAYMACRELKISVPDVVCVTLS
jgi:hypothetical protein